MWLIVISISIHWHQILFSTEKDMNFIRNWTLLASFSWDFKKWKQNVKFFTFISEFSDFPQRKSWSIYVTSGQRLDGVLVFWKREWKKKDNSNSICFGSHVCCFNAVHLFIQGFPSLAGRPLQEYTHLRSNFSLLKRRLEVENYINVMLIKCFHSLDLRMTKLSCLWKQKTTDTWKLKPNQKAKQLFDCYFYSGDLGIKAWVTIFLLILTTPMSQSSLKAASLVWGQRKWWYMNSAVQHGDVGELCSSWHKPIHIKGREVWEGWFHCLPQPFEVRVFYFSCHQNKDKWPSNPWTSIFPHQSPTTFLYFFLFLSSSFLSLLFMSKPELSQKALL